MINDKTISFTIISIIRGNHMQYLFGIAVLPSILLMLFVYLKDKNEKEPLGLLASLFFLGVASVIPAAISEALLIGDDSPYDLPSLFIQCVFVIGLSEELCKFIFLFIRTWKSKHFNYTYDGIVYAVFVSLGFATLENIMYVFSKGFGVGILRALTSIPGHTFFAVLMGFFYSQAKLAASKKKYIGMTVNIILSLIIPILIHGVYDTIAMTGSLWALLIFFLFCFA